MTPIQALAPLASPFGMDGDGDPLALVPAGVTLTGTGGADTLIGTVGADQLSGLEGDDLLIGGAGADTLDGGKGQDTASYDGAGAGVTASLVAPGTNTGDAAGDVYSSIENLTGTRYADTLTGNDAANVLTGGGGPDVLNGMGGLDTASYANAGEGVSASLAAPAGNTGDAAGDSYSSIENLLGSIFADALSGDAGANRLSGGEGDDILEGGAGADTIDGGGGTDAASYAGAGAAVSASLATPGSNTGDAAGDSYAAIENLIGSAFADSLTGDGGDNMLTGGAGGDAMNGMGGSDTASYGTSLGPVSASLAAPGANTGDAAGDSYVSIENLTGSAFNDFLGGDAGANILTGLYGDDTLNGGAGGDLLSGWAGIDTATYESAAAGVTANLTTPGLNTGEAAGDTYQSIENLTGTGFNDVLTGSSGSVGGPGTNVLSGLGGADILQGRGGADVLDGGLGTDTASYQDAVAGVFASLTTPASNTGEAQGDSYISIENLTGSAFNDTLVGDGGLNRLTGGDGDDVLMSGGGGSWGGFQFEFLDGGAGNDTASYADAPAGVTAIINSNVNTGWADGDLYTSIENVAGSNFDDVLGGDAGNNILSGLSGADLLLGDDGADVLNGGAGLDTVSYVYSGAGIVANLTAPGSNTGLAAGDSYVSIENLVGTSFNDTLTGNAGANRIASGNGDDNLYGLGGDDTLTGGVGWDLFNGGAGSDTVDYSWLGFGQTWNLSLTGWQNQDKFISIENLIGSGYADVLIGNADVNSLAGGGGNDTLEGLVGADTLNGGAGRDAASYAHGLTGMLVSLTTPASNTGDAAGDVYISIEDLIGTTLVDSLIGDGGANVLTGLAGGDILNGMGGSDTAGYGGAAAGVSASLSAPGTNTGDAANDFYISIENLSGSSYGDRLTGDGGANVLTGYNGDDTLAGLAGADSLDGGAGSDTASYAGASIGVVASLTSPGSNSGDAAGDSYVSIENLAGTSFADVLTGDAGANVLSGGAGADSLNGMGGLDCAGYGTASAGLTASLTTPASNTGDAAGDTYSSIEGLVGSAFADTLTGDGGLNLLIGGAGADLLSGLGGQDTLTGGAGPDRYIFTALGDTLQSAPDYISDFTTGDRIDLHLIDADITVSGDQAFHLDGTSGGAGDIRVTYDATHFRTVVDIYVDNNASVDARIWLAGDHSGLTASDFVL